MGIDQPANANLPEGKDSTYQDPFLGIVKIGGQLHDRCLESFMSCTSELTPFGKLIFEDVKKSSLKKGGFLLPGILVCWRVTWKMDEWLTNSGHTLPFCLTHFQALAVPSQDWRVLPTKTRAPRNLVANSSGTELKLAVHTSWSYLLNTYINIYTHKKWYIYIYVYISKPPGAKNLEASPQQGFWNAEWWKCLVNYGLYGCFQK